MAKAILICGRICCGKTSYANGLRRKGKAVLLSMDELMLTLYGEYLGEKHESCAEKCRNYLLQKSLEVLEAETDVILDWGFWSRQSREETRSFFQKHGYEAEIHYLPISEEEWIQRCRRRNMLIDCGKVQAYHVDERLAEKSLRLFEEPDRSEADVWLNS